MDDLTDADYMFRDDGRVVGESGIVFRVGSGVDLDHSGQYAAFGRFAYAYHLPARR